MASSVTIKGTQLVQEGHGPATPTVSAQNDATVTQERWLRFGPGGGSSPKGHVTLELFDKNGVSLQKINKDPGTFIGINIDKAAGSTTHQINGNFIEVQCGTDLFDGAGGKFVLSSSGKISGYRLYDGGDQSQSPPATPAYEISISGNGVYELTVPVIANT